MNASAWAYPEQPKIEPFSSSQLPSNLGCLVAAGVAGFGFLLLLRFLLRRRPDPDSSPPAGVGVEAGVGAVDRVSSGMFMSLMSLRTACRFHCALLFQVLCASRSSRYHSVRVASRRFVPFCTSVRVTSLRSASRRFVPIDLILKMLKPQSHVYPHCANEATD